MASVSSDVQQEAYSPRLFLNTFFSDHTVLNQEEIFTFPLEHLHEVFKTGGIKGKVLISCAFGPVLLHVLSASEHFKELYLATTSEADEAEYKKWLQKKPDAFDWTPVIKHLCTLEGDVEKCADKERILRASVKQCLTFDMTKSNPFHPVVLPAADCVILYFFLESVGTDKETCIKYLRKVVAHIKDGGHLVIYAVFDNSFFKVGDQKFSCFTFNEQFVKEALDVVGCEIDKFFCIDRTNPSDTRYADYKKVALFVARKKGSV